MAKKKALSEKAISWIALLVSVTSVIFIYVQTTTTKAQLKLNELQIRPFVKYIPAFFESKQVVNVDMRLENLSAVPASVIYTELIGWVDGVTTGVNLHSTTEDILYQHRGGTSDLPPIKGELAKQLLNGDSVLQIGVCVIYTPLSKADTRRWQMSSLYEYVPGSAFPMTMFVQEVEVSASEKTCSSKQTRDQWLQMRSTASTK